MLLAFDGEVVGGWWVVAFMVRIGDCLHARKTQGESSTGISFEIRIRLFQSSCRAVL